MSRIGRHAGGFVVAAVLASSVSAQEPQRRPTFRGTVSVATIDVTVVGSDGRPVTDLRPDEIQIRVNRQPRDVVAAAPLPAITAEGAVAGRDPRARDTVTNAGATAATSREPRVIVMFFDDLSFDTLEGRALAEAAVRFVARVPPADLVASISASGLGPQVGPTTDRRRVQQALGRYVGQRSRPVIGEYSISTTEALRIHEGKEDTRKAVVDRECAGRRGPDRQICELEVESFALAIAGEVRMQAARQNDRVLSVLRALDGVPGGSQVIYLTRGIPRVDSELPNTHRLRDLAAANNVTLFALHQPPPEFDIHARKPMKNPAEDRGLEEAGLGTIVGAVDGTVVPAVGTAERVFERLEGELNSLYRIGFALESSDTGAGPRTVDIQVTRRGVRVKPERRSMAFAAVKPDATESLTPEERLAQLLRGRMQVNGLPLSARAFVTREAEGRGLLLRVVATAATENPVRAAFALVASSGANVASGTLPSALPPKGGSVPFGFEGVVPPGDYTLKIAALSETGEAGSLEYPFRARLNRAGDLVLSDPLIWAGPRESPVYAAEPVITTADGFHTRVDIFASTAAPVAPHDVVVSVMGAAPEPVISVRGTVAGGTRATSAQAWIPVRDLASGEYRLITDIESAGKRVTRLEQSFTLEKTAAPVAPIDVPAVAAPAAPPPVVAPPVARFAPRDWLAEGGAAAIAEAFESFGVTVPPFSPDLAALKRADAETPAGRVSRAVVALAEGRVDDAQRAIDALGAQLRRVPATLVVTGAILASRGRDMDAVGAWRTAGAAGIESPAIVAAIVDALRRAGQDADAAVALREALARWPGHALLTSRERH